MLDFFFCEYAECVGGFYILKSFYYIPKSFCILKIFLCAQELLYFQELFDIPREDHFSLFVGEGDFIEALKLGFGIPHREVGREEESVRTVHIDDFLCLLSADEGEGGTGVKVDVLKTEVERCVAPGAVAAEVRRDEIDLGVFFSHSDKSLGL